MLCGAVTDWSVSKGWFCFFFTQHVFEMCANGTQLLQGRRRGMGWLLDVV